jgi:hypothetical protein
VDGEVAAGADDFGVSLLGRSAAFGVGNPDTTITSTSTINDGQWHHVAATRSALSGLMQLYVDGNLQASATGPFGPKSAPPNLRVGSIQSGAPGGYLTGTIGDVQIFNRVLSTSEISVVMNQTLTVAPIAAINLVAGQTLSVSNSAVDPYTPPLTLAWSLLNGPVGALIDPASGLLTWRPTIAQSPSTNSISVVVSDNGSPGLSSTQTFLVTVRQPVRPQISSVMMKNGALQFNITGDSGLDYIIEISTNLSLPASWLPVLSNTSAVLPVIITNPICTNFNQQYYRILLGP